MSNIKLPATAGNARVDTFTRVEGADTVHVQAVAAVEPVTGIPVTGLAELACSNVNALNGDIFSIDASGFEQILFQTKGTFSGTITFQASNDGTNWDNVSAQPASGGAQSATATATNKLYAIPVVAKYMRARVTTYTSGTFQGVGFLSNSPLWMPPSTVSANSTNQASTNLIGDVSLGVRTTSTNAGSRYKVKSAASNNAGAIKASAGRVYGVQLTNTHASAFRYVKLYNKTTAPIPGTDVPVSIVAIPPGAHVDYIFQIGVHYSTGIAVLIVAGPDDSDNTAIGANDVIGGIYYA